MFSRLFAAYLPPTNHRKDGLIGLALIDPKPIVLLLVSQPATYMLWKSGRGLRLSGSERPTMPEDSPVEGQTGVVRPTVVDILDALRGADRDLSQLDVTAVWLAELQLRSVSRAPWSLATHHHVVAINATRRFARSVAQCKRLSLRHSRGTSSRIISSVFLFASDRVRTAAVAVCFLQNEARRRRRELAATRRTGSQKSGDP